VTIQGGLDALFRHDDQVFVAGDLFWYPMEGAPRIRTAPDILVVFGWSKGHRRSYKQWEEGNIAPQVVFEIRSPGNRFGELQEKFQFYERYGVEEYYLYDPDFNTLEGWIRHKGTLRSIDWINGWTSPLLKVRFVVNGNTLTIYRPDGEKFASYVELEEQRASALLEAKSAQKKAEEEQKLRQAAEAEKERLAAKLRELGISPEA